MSVATEISKLQTNLMDAYSSIESKGGTLPENQNFDNLSTSINSISGGTSYTAGTGIDITNNVISVEGVKNQRNTSTAIKTWTGTRSQYDAILVKDSNTLYNITDDTDASLTLLNLLYPVGSIYITTNETCPLAVLISGSTWIKEATGVITGLSETAPCKGNGKALGFDTGITSPAGYEHLGLRIGDGSQSSLLTATTGNYDATVGDATTGSGTAMGFVGGVTTDATKSGIITDLSSVATSYSVNLFRRTL